MFFFWGGMGLVELGGVLRAWIFWCFSVEFFGHKVTKVFFVPVEKSVRQKKVF